MQQIINYLYAVCLLPFFCNGMELLKNPARITVLNELASTRLLFDTLREDRLSLFLESLSHEEALKTLYRYFRDIPVMSFTERQKTQLIRHLYGNSKQQFNLEERVCLILRVLRAQRMTKKAKLEFLAMYQEEAAILVEKNAIDPEYEKIESPLIQLFIKLLKQDNVINIRGNNVVHATYYQKDAQNSTTVFLKKEGLPRHHATYSASLLTYAIYWQNPFLIKILFHLGIAYNYIAIDLEDLYNGGYIAVINPDGSEKPCPHTTECMLLAIYTLNPLVILAFLDGVLVQNKGQKIRFPKNALRNLLGIVAIQKKNSLADSSLNPDDGLINALLTILASHGLPLNEQGDWCLEPNNIITVLPLDAVALLFKEHYFPASILEWLLEHGAALSPSGVEAFCDKAYNKCTKHFIARTTTGGYYNQTVLKRFVRKYGSIETLPAQFNKYKPLIAILLNDSDFFKETPVQKLHTTAYTLLHYAVYFGRLEIVRLLIAHHGLSPFQRDAKRMLPLHRASMSGQMEVISYLLSTGKEIGLNVTDAYGQKPLNYAMQNGNKEVITLLKQHGAVATEHTKFLQDANDSDKD